MAVIGSETRIPEEGALEIWFTPSQLGVGVLILAAVAGIASVVWPPADPGIKVWDASDGKPEPK